MSRPIPPNRTYSFELDDEHSLRQGQEPLRQYSPGPLSPPTPYRDESPTRPNAAPLPPGYTYDPFQNAPGPSQNHYTSQHANPFGDQAATEYNPHANRAQDIGYTQSMRTASTTTPGMDNFGESSVGGGLVGLAHGVASHNERESGLQAARGLPPGYSQPAAPRIGQDNPYIPQSPNRAQNGPGARHSAAYSHPGWASQASTRPDEDPHAGHYQAQPVYGGDGPYKRYSSPWDPRVDGAAFDPADIADDADDVFADPASRHSMLSLGRSSRTGLSRGHSGGAGAGAMAAGGALGAGAAGAGEYYGHVPGGNHPALEKAGMLAEEARQRKRKRIILIAIGVLIICGIIAGAVVGGILGSQKANDSSGDPSGSDADGLYDKDSSQVQELLGNSDLKMVFPGIDYTPFNAQYPACLSNMPSQNNVTMDMAVLSQMTKTIRLYGTDCNQTDMVLEAFRRLDITNMKVWLGVWLDNNQTTNDRGIAAMYDILDRNGPDPFAGVIIGNEVLFRQDLTVTELSTLISDVRQNFTEKKITLPIGVADLGDNWAKDGADFIQNVDAVMSNVHPFFAGIAADKAAAWAWSFWSQFDLGLTKGTTKQNIISEIGWNDGQGNDCGVDSSGNDIKCTSPTQGAIPGVSEMNTFMADFVCEALSNSTNYFWFEAFDEPWKAQFDTPGQDWEDHWGLMTPDRKLKDGLTIPDCSGQRIP